MTSDKSNIGQLFKDSFSEYKVHEPSGEWAAIEAKLSFVNFMHFGLFNFNIYYALLIGGSIAINVFLVINYFSSKQNENLNNIIPSDSAIFFNRQDSLINNIKIEPKYESKDIEGENSVHSQKKKIIEPEKANPKNKVSIKYLPIELETSDNNLQYKENNTNQKNASIDDINVIDDPDQKIPEQENNYIKTDSLPNQSHGLTLSDSISNKKELDTVIYKPDTSKDIIRKTITVKPDNIIERDTVIIYKKRKKNK